MNVYDWDKTIFYGDSTIRFYFFCLKRYPKTWIYIPYQMLSLVLYKFKRFDLTELKTRFYIFFKGVRNIDNAVLDFWEINKIDIKPFYLSQQKDDDVIISASPYFLLKPMTDKLGIKYLMASNVDKLTGKHSGVNCSNKEKVRRFLEIFPNGVIEEFYSDSLVDTPLAEIAKKAYMVDKDEIFEWQFK